MSYEQSVKQWVVETYFGNRRNQFLSKYGFFEDDIESVRFIGIAGTCYDPKDCDRLDFSYIFTGIEIVLKYGLILEAWLPTEEPIIPDFLIAVLATAKDQPSDMSTISGVYGHELTDNPWHGYAILPKPPTLSDSQEEAAQELQASLKVQKSLEDLMDRLSPFAENNADRKAIQDLEPDGKNSFASYADFLEVWQDHQDYVMNPRGGRGLQTKNRNRIIDFIERLGSGKIAQINTSISNLAVDDVVGFNVVLESGRTCTAYGVVSFIEHHEDRGLVIYFELGSLAIWGTGLVYYYETSYHGWYVSDIVNVMSEALI